MPQCAIDCMTQTHDGRIRVCNPATGRCILADSATGRKLYRNAGMTLKHDHIAGFRFHVDALINEFGDRMALRNDALMYLYRVFKNAFADKSYDQILAQLVGEVREHAISSVVINRSIPPNKKYVHFFARAAAQMSPSERLVDYVLAEFLNELYDHMYRVEKRFYATIDDVEYILRTDQELRESLQGTSAVKTAAKKTGAKTAGVKTANAAGSKYPRQGRCKKGFRKSSDGKWCVKT